ncbi:MAG: AMP-binding protein [Rhizobiales bacterium]|nr:AMP-binding protein [Hyphomicrobiales bacterium]
MQYLVHHMLLESAARRPNHVAFVDDQHRLDYGTAARQVAALAHQLQSLGICRGDRVAIYLKPGVDLPLAILAISMAGAVFVPVHHGQFPNQVSHILCDSGAAALITDGQRLERLGSVLNEGPSLRFAVAVQPKAEHVGGLPVYDFRDLAGSTQTACLEECIEKDLAAILYTSGSTGRPKGVMLSHANVLAGAEIVSEYLALTEDDRVLAALPMSFDAGLNQLTTALLKGCTTVLLDFRFGRDIVQRLVQEKITGLAGVPSLWSLLAQPSSGLAKQSLPDLRYITNTGGALPQNVLQQLRDALPDTDIVLMYGLTEAFRSTYLPPAELDRRPTSMGKAIPNTEIMVINEDGKLCQAGEIGELVHHGPTVSQGYWGHPDLTAKVLRPHPAPQPGRTNSDLVCYSGDLVKRDEEGFLYFVGRRDNQIKSAGFRISPTEVEDVICRVAPIRQAAVVGAPDEVLGQILVAFAIPQERSEALEPTQVLSSCASKLPRHMIPKRIFLVDELPMTSSGKVNYPALRERVLTEAGGNTSPAPARELDLADG